MGIKFIFWISIFVAIALLASHKQVRDWLDKNNIAHLDFQGYFRIIGVCIIIMVLIIAFNVGGERKVDGDYYKVKSAFKAAKEEVKKNLKAPSTAVFADEFEDESKYKINGDGSVVIRSYVDAENSFGAKIRTYYRCNVSPSGEVYDLVTW